MSRHGFTLIEMLVTISVFGLALATLLAGLHISLGTRERVERRIAQSQEMMLATSQIRDDLSSTYLAKGNKKITFSTDAANAKTLEFCRLASKTAESSDWRQHLQHVRYALEKSDEADNSRLVRYEAPIVLDDAVDPHDTSVLIENVKDVEYSFFTKDTWKDRWGDNSKLPQAVRIKGTETRNGKAFDFTVTVRIPASENYGVSN